MIRDIDYVRDLLKEKEKKVTTEEDKEKIELLKSVLTNDKAFFAIEISTAVGILDFLEVPIDEIKQLYLELISPQNYFKGDKQYFNLETRS